MQRPASASQTRKSSNYTYYQQEIHQVLLTQVSYKLKYNELSAIILSNSSDSLFSEKLSYLDESDMATKIGH